MTLCKTSNLQSKDKTFNMFFFTLPTAFNIMSRCHRWVWKISCKEFGRLLLRAISPRCCRGVFAVQLENIYKLLLPECIASSCTIPPHRTCSTETPFADKLLEQWHVQAKIFTHCSVFFGNKNHNSSVEKLNNVLSEDFVCPPTCSP